MNHKVREGTHKHSSIVVNRTARAIALLWSSSAVIYGLGILPTKHIPLLIAAFVAAIVCFGCYLWLRRDTLSVAPRLFLILAALAVLSFGCDGFSLDRERQIMGLWIFPIAIATGLLINVSEKIPLIALFLLEISLAGYYEFGKGGLLIKSPADLPDALVYATVPLVLGSSILVAWRSRLTSLRLIEKLGLSAQQLTESQEISGVGTWMMEFPSRKRTWSLEVYKLFELSPEFPQEKISEYFKEHVREQDFLQIEENLERARKNGEDFNADFQLLFDGGKRVKYFRGIGRAHRDPKGNIAYMLGTIQNLTETHQNRKSER